VAFERSGMDGCSSRVVGVRCPRSVDEAGPAAYDGPGIILNERCRALPTGRSRLFHYVSLQNHDRGSSVYFKDIFVTELK